MAAQDETTYASHDWEAWYNRQPGADDPRLHVVGKVDLPSSSIVATLEFWTDGVIDEPDLVTLRVVVDVPDVGDDLFVTKDLVWEENVGPDIKRVRILGDEHPHDIEVQIVE